jgi:nicotinate-nucleotide pyrophosphorylase (carboxylating)
MQNQNSSLIRQWLEEDGWGECQTYWSSLPETPSQCVLKIKSPLMLAGLEWFIEVFDFLQPGLISALRPLKEYEGRYFSGPCEIALPVHLKWSTAISGERLALNLIHRASSVATLTHQFVQKASAKNILILDTRKTTPGLRELEKYAVRLAGGANHRFSQVDTFMVKDNHKEFFGLEGAVKFFQELKQPYKNIIVEVHSLQELNVLRDLGMKHFMLDNFSVSHIHQACIEKREGEFFEISGGINLENMDQYLIEGVNALSVGKLTQFPAPVDISFKFKAVK